MKKLKDFLFAFVCITTGVLFVSAAYITIFWPQVMLGVEILWQIIFVSFLCSVGICIFPEQQEANRRRVVLLHFLSYLEINVIVLGCGFWFGWFRLDDVLMVVGMVVAIAFVFLLVSAAIWNWNKRLAAEMNGKLLEYQKKIDQDKNMC